MAKMQERTEAAGRRRAKKTVDKWKVKKWYEMHASPEFNEIYIGQTPGEDDEHVSGRIIENSLYDFTQDFNHVSIKLRFKVSEVNGQLCNTTFVGHELTRDFIRSLVRRGSNRIDAIVNVKTKEGYVFRITSTIFTHAMSKTSQQNVIRKIMTDILTEKGNNLELKEFVQEMVFGSIERDIKRIANEISPIRDCKLVKSKLVGVPKA